MENFELKVEIKEIPLELIEENTGQIPGVPKNPRKITKAKFESLCESIEASPEMKSLDEIKVYPYKGRYIAISGNHRCRAYKRLGWENALCKVLPEDTPTEKLREYVIKENQHYAENDDKLLKAWDIKELVKWDVPINVKGRGVTEKGDVEFTEILDESHNYVVLYFDNEVDWLQAQTLFGIKPVKLLSTARNKSNIQGQKIGIGRVLRGSEVLNRILGENSLGRTFNENKEEK
jgi:uncharacterized ParB-like nuclease family protein